jgi:hypothetical protein
MDTLKAFEKGMGLTLKNAWLHSEAVQTTDLPLLIEYIHDVFNYCLENPNVSGFMKKSSARDEGGLL